MTVQVTAGNVAVSDQLPHLTVHGICYFPNQYDQYYFLKSVHCYIVCIRRDGFQDYWQVVDGIFVINEFFF